jgi:pseudaminic acid synthase
VGGEFEPYIVAEMSANHRGRLDIAHRIVEAAAFAGADAIKLQHYKPESMTIECNLPEYRIQGGTLWDGRTLFDLYGEAMTPWEWTDQLMAHASELGLHFFSTPFDNEAVDFLHARQVPAFKIASFELVHLPLIRYAASLMRPMILSTGMATAEEIDAAVRIVRETGNDQLIVLKCNSSYPANSDELNLASIAEISRRWSVVSGLSDHTRDSVSALVALGLGAAIFEKHLMVAESDGSPDAAFSLQPDDFKRYVADIRCGYRAIGNVKFEPTPREVPSLAFKRSVRATSDISAGEYLTEQNVAALRPAGGMSPTILFRTGSYKTIRAVRKGEAITENNVRLVQVEGLT